MVKLTERLKCMADRVPPCKTMADIGTDHGFLPLYLWEQKIIEKFIATDISKGSLQKAETNMKLLHPGVSFDLRLGDGLDVINKGEVEAVVMAGIGGILITEILDWDVEKSKSFSRLILQPRNNSGRLRRYLFKEGYHILYEDIIPEGKRICEIITAKPNEGMDAAYRDEIIEDYRKWGESAFEYPFALVKHPGKYTEEYLQSRLSGEISVLEKIKEEPDAKDVEEEQSSPSESLIEAVQLRNSRIKRLEYLLSEI